MLGYIIYHSVEANKNKKFIEMFTEYGKINNIEIIYIPYEQYRSQNTPDFVINRTRDKRVSKWYESLGVRVFHSEELVEIGNDKWKSILYLYNYLNEMNCENRKWIPDTFYYDLSDSEIIYNDGIIWNSDRGILWSVKYNRMDVEKKFATKKVVAKTVDGHGGNEVYLFDSFEIFWKQKNKVFGNRKVIVQEQIISDSEDVRIYIVGNKYYQGMLRHGENSFKSNYSLGGKAQKYDLSDKELLNIQNVLDCFYRLNLGMAGIDFIVGKDGKFYFNELEEMVGSRMLYSNTSKDIVKDYLLWIKGELY